MMCFYINEVLFPGLITILQYTLTIFCRISEVLLSNKFHFNIQLVTEQENVLSGKEVMFYREERQ